MQIALPTDPLWLKAAFADLGVFEVPGPGSNPRVTQMYAAAHVPHPETLDDSKFAWCSAAMNLWVAEANLVPTYNLMARSWLRWGKPIDSEDKVPRGAILVFRRGGSGIEGHVCLCLADNGDSFTVIGGNQSDPHGGAVTIATLPASALLGARWPDTPGNSRTVQSIAGGGLGFTGAQAAGGVADHAQDLGSLLGMAQDKIEQYATSFAWAQRALFVLGMLSLAYGVYHYVTAHLRPQPAPDSFAGRERNEGDPDTVDGAIEVQPRDPAPAGAAQAEDAAMIQTSIAELAAKYALQLVVAGVLALAAGGGLLGLRHHYIGIGYQQAMDGIAAQDREAINAADQARERVRACTHAGGVWDIIEGQCAR